MRQIAVSLALFLAATLPAKGDPAEEAFTAGRFLEAATIAEQAGGADNLARAARCILANEIATGALDDAALHRAEKLARVALQDDPDHAEARLQLAIALSMQSRLLSTREVLSAGYGKTGRDLAEAVLKDDPANIYAHGFLAVWNIEVLHRGGSLGAAWFGASLSNAREHFEKARRLDAQDGSLCWQYARALAALDYRRHQDEIFEVLTCAVTAPAKGEMEKVLQTRARDFWTFAQAHTGNQIQARAADLL